MSKEIEWQLPLQGFPKVGNQSEKSWIHSTAALSFSIDLRHNLSYDSFRLSYFICHAFVLTMKKVHLFSISTEEIWQKAEFSWTNYSPLEITFCARKICSFFSFFFFPTNDKVSSLNKKYYLKKEYSYITFPQNSDIFLAPLCKKKHATSWELYIQ